MAPTRASKKRPNAAEDETLSAKRRRQFGSNIVTLRVGKADLGITPTVSVHETLLQDSSPFFKAALEKNWKESQTRTIELPTDSLDTVTAYVDYLYSRSKTVEVEPFEDGNPFFGALARLYCFGEKILDDVLCDIVLSIMIDNCVNSKYVPGFGVAEIIYAGTPPGSGMRQFVAHMIARNVHSKWNFTATCPELAHDVIMEMSKNRTESGVKKTLQSDREKWMKIKPKKE